MHKYDFIKPMLQGVLSLADKYDMLPPGGRILACVSGGADSMCLLAALLELAPVRSLTVIAAHYNHMLRGGESGRDEAFVREYCSNRGVEILTRSGDVAAFAKERGVGIEAAARLKRYEFFEEAAREAGADRIATAHTADDNAETVIMHLTRGAGTAGLSGIPPVRGMIVRPMLEATRDEVMRFITERCVPYVEDSTNAVDLYVRNRVRHGVMPPLRELNPRFLEAVSSATALLREDEEYLSGLAEAFIEENMDGNRVSAGALAALPPAVSGRVIRSLCGAGTSRRHAEAVLSLCTRGGGFRRLSLPGIIVYREQDHILFGGEGAREFEPFEPKVGEMVIIRGTGLKMSCKFGVFNDKINKSFTTFRFKQSKICGKIIVRPRTAGDELKITGRNGTKSLKKLFIDGRVPARSRGLVPVVADGYGVLAVCGFGAGERAGAEPGEAALELKFERTFDND